MLVLSRQVDQKIRIEVPASSTPTLIDVTCVDIRGDKVRIGFEAPRDVEIKRHELYDRVLNAVDRSISRSRDGQAAAAR